MEGVTPLVLCSFSCKLAVGWVCVFYYARSSSSVCTRLKLAIIQGHHL